MPKQAQGHDGWLYVLDASGQRLQLEAVPPGLPVGSTFDVQGAVLQPSGCPILLTTALYGTAQ